MSGLMFDTVLKQSKAFRFILSDLKIGLGHAYSVISGDDDVVDEFFTLIAAAVYCKNDHEACFKCAECKKILHSNHADVFHLNETRDKIKVEEISRMLSSVSIKSLAGRKLYFIHRADLMTAQAQNKLLKTLEEPPEGVTVFLGIANESAILDTVKSRVRSLHIDLFDEDTVYNTMLALGYNDEMSTVSAACCEGMLGKARRIASSPKYVSLYRSALDMLTHLGRSSDVARLDSLFANQDGIGEFLDILSIIVRDMLVAQSDANMILSKHMYGEIAALSEGYSQLALSKILAAINDTRRQLTLNVGALSAVDNLLFSILEVKHKCPK